ncbi:MAG TPA: right-handed parallel beta-helix repeat-containing protein [bacterium]|nr:right-handed parallel beta-helix repeat-containing protein [bacterium]
MARLLLLLCLVCLLMVALPATSPAHTWHVRPDGTGDAPTIGAAMDSAAVGDTLELASGTFQGSGNYGLVVPDKRLTILSETRNPADCTIDLRGQPGDRFGFEFCCVRSKLVGLTISHAASSALRIDYDWNGSKATQVTIGSCIFVSNASGYTGGAINMNCDYGSVYVADCQFLSNSADFGGGAIYIRGVGSVLMVTIENCLFSDNIAGDVGGAIFSEKDEVSNSIRNSVFYHNSARAGGGICVGTTGAGLFNCTFVANSASEFGSAVSSGEGVAAHNCIIAYNTGGCGFADYGDESGYPNSSLYCTDIYGNPGGDWVGPLASLLGQYDNFSGCPGFCSWDIEPYDLQLCETSPCLPGNHPQGANCGLIGALGQGCACGPSETQPSTWGSIKAMYR